MKIEYRVVEEWAAPIYYDYDTGEELYDECDSSRQRLWVVIYDKDEHEIVEWVEEYFISDIEIAKSRAKALNEKGEL